MGYNNIRRLRWRCEGMDAEERIENVYFVQVEFYARSKVPKRVNVFVEKCINAS